ncbi:MAG: TRAP transporter substrate-binding protein DctP [Lachnospiraceae bacterium]|nr:TRAP transporter substrate-binding protein DctP [Lachnospiraceae bacterium]
MYKKAMLLILILTCSLNGCAEATEFSTEATETQVEEAAWKMGIGYSGTGYTSLFTEWADSVREDTGGEVELSLYGDNILGEAEVMLEAVQNGTLSIMACSTSVCNDLISEVSVMDIPACYTDYVKTNVVYTGDFYELMNECYRKQGLELLYIGTGEYWIISSSEPLTSLEDLNGLRIRSIGNTFHEELYTLLGVESVADVGLNGLSYVINDNEVDIVETTYSILRSQDLLSLQPYGLQGPFFAMSSAIVMNLEAYDSLPEEYQKAIKGDLWELSRQRAQERAEEADTEGLDLTILSDEEVEQLRELAQPVLEHVFQTVDSELLEALTRENEEYD